MTSESLAQDQLYSSRTWLQYNFESILWNLFLYVVFCIFIKCVVYGKTLSKVEVSVNINIYKYLHLLFKYTVNPASKTKLLIGTSYYCRFHVFSWKFLRKLLKHFQPARGAPLTHKWSPWKAGNERLDTDPKYTALHMMWVLWQLFLVFYVILNVFLKAQISRYVEHIRSFV